MQDKFLDIFLNIVDECDSVCIMGHSSPDGDCIMSVLIMHDLLKQLGKDADVALQGKIPYNYNKYLSDIEKVTIATDMKKKYDLAIAVDTASLERLGEYADLFSRAKKNIVIDHHNTNEGFGFVNLVDITAGSTCEILYQLFDDYEKKMDPNVTEYIYVGILTDTGKFHYSSISGDTHRILGDLLDKGVKPAQIYKEIFATKPLAIVKACGQIMSNVKLTDSGKVAIAKVTNDLAQINNGNIDEIDGIVDWLMEIEGVEIGCVIKEVDDELIKVSLRSTEDHNLPVLARKYKGGGHKCAAGFNIYHNLDEAVELVSDELEKMVVGKYSV